MPKTEIKSIEGLVQYFEFNNRKQAMFLLKNT